MAINLCGRRLIYISLILYIGYKMLDKLGKA